MNTVPRHSDTLYCSVLCVFITLGVIVFFMVPDKNKADTRESILLSRLMVGLSWIRKPVGGNIILFLEICALLGLNAAQNGS
jgi:hypothetical protein